MSKKANVPEISPVVAVDHDRKKYHIEIELPGVRKDQIELEVGERSFCVRAPRNDIVFNACYTLGHTVDSSKVEASFDAGLLKVNVPLKDALGGKKVAIT